MTEQETEAEEAVGPCYPEGWPDDCPPPDAEDAAGTVHRIVSHSPTTPEDFISHAEAGTALHAPECGRRGVSVFASRAKACHRLKLSPHLGTMVATGTLDATHGRMKLTSQRSGHIEWWPYAGVDRHILFPRATSCP